MSEDTFLNKIFSITSERRPEVMDDHQVWHLLLDAVFNFAVLIAFFSFFFIAYKLLPQRVKKAVWHFVDVNIKWYLTFVWIIGFVTYYIGSYVQGSGTFFNTVPMAIIHASGMFLGVSDISAIRSAQHDSALYMSFFDVGHILAVLGSFIFIIRQFGYFISASIRMQYEGKLCAMKNWYRKKMNTCDGQKSTGKSQKRIIKKYDELFVFWGINNASINLAKSILTERQKCKKNMHIVFVRTFDEPDKNSQTFHLGKLFDKIKMKYEEMEQLSELECFVSTSFHRLSAINLNELEPCVDPSSLDESKYYDVLKKKLEQYSLAKMIENSKTTSFFFFGNDYGRNVNATTNLLCDITVKNNDVSIYCRARKSQLTEWIEFYDLTNKEDKTRVRIIDSASIAIEELRSNLVDQPVSYVSVNNDATVSDKFESLIIGFGDIGHNALKYIYEFSAFADRDRHRSPFAIHVVDRNMNSIVGQFLLDNPSLSKYLDGKDKKHLLEFCEMDVNETVFWESLKSYIKDLNYVIIALGNDSEQMELALTLYHYAIRERSGDLNKFCIYLYRNNETYPINFSNPIKFVDKALSSSNGHIKEFGKTENAFTYDIIIKDKLTKEAKKFLEGYNKVNGEGKDWETRRMICKNDYYSMFNLKRKESQDYANAMHADTKNSLFTHAMMQSYPDFKLTRDVLYGFVKMTKTGKMESQHDKNSMHYFVPEHYDDKLVNEIFLNLAITEHLRWNASHEMLGYVGDPLSVEADQIKKTHNCLVEWDELDDVSTRSWEASWNTDYKYYDYMIFETTLSLCLDETK